MLHTRYEGDRPPRGRQRKQLLEALCGAGAHQPPLHHVLHAAATVANGQKQQHHQSWRTCGCRTTRVFMRVGGRSGQSVLPASAAHALDVHVVWHSIAPSLACRPGCAWQQRHTQTSPPPPPTPLARHARTSTYMHMRTRARARTSSPLMLGRTSAHNIATDVH